VRWHTAPVVREMRLLVPLENENRWTDLLAVLIATDPVAAARTLRLGNITGRQVTVAREVRAGGERVDLEVFVDDRLRTVVEAKVLSGLSPSQLARYSDAYPSAGAYVLTHPARLVIDPGAGSGWRAISWETLLAPFTKSTNSWVAETSAAWLDHLSRTLPHVNARTRWNSLRPDDPIPLVMRARMSWVYSRLKPPTPLIADFMASGGSKAWVARLQMPAPAAGYVVAAELEDPSARAWPARFDPDGPNPVTGPRVWVGLRQHGVEGSEDFNWDYLAALWPLMRSSRNDWMATRPGLPAAHDRAAWHRIGAPLGLGYGFGHREATKRGVCMFGGRIRLPADIRLGDLVDELHQVADLLLTMAVQRPPRRRIAKSMA
jgi:hypothetical protein